MVSVHFPSVGVFNFIKMIAKFFCAESENTTFEIRPIEDGVYFYTEQVNESYTEILLTKLDRNDLKDIVDFLNLQIKNLDEHGK